MLGQGGVHLPWTLPLSKRMCRNINKRISRYLEGIFSDNSDDSRVSVISSLTLTVICTKRKEYKQKQRSDYQIRCTCLPGNTLSKSVFISSTSTPCRGLEDIKICLCAVTYLTSADPSSAVSHAHCQ